MEQTLFAPTPTNIMFVIGILGIIFAVYRYFRDPQVDNDKKDALLSQQAQWTIESNERRFKDMQDNFSALLLQSNNHIKTVDNKVEMINATIGVMSNEITKLTTIIDERMPKQKS